MTKEFIFTYKQRLPWWMLTYEEREGLDYALTEQRFRERINQALCYKAPTEDMTEFVIDNRVSRYRLRGDSDWLIGRYKQLCINRIEDQFINIYWLTYTSAERHVEALGNVLRQNVVNHAVILSSVLVSNYQDRKPDDLFALVEKGKNKEVWKKTIFVLG